MLKCVWGSRLCFPFPKTHQQFAICTIYIYGRKKNKEFRFLDALLMQCNMYICHYRLKRTFVILGRYIMSYCTVPWLTLKALI